MVFQRLFDIILCSEVGVGQEILTLLHGGGGGGVFDACSKVNQRN